MLCETEDISDESRLHRCVATDKSVMLKFIGIVAYMGIMRISSLEKNWSKDDLFKNSVIPKTMTRNKFQLLL